MAQRRAREAARERLARGGRGPRARREKGQGGGALGARRRRFTFRGAGTPDATKAQVEKKQTLSAAELEAENEEDSDFIASESDDDDARDDPVNNPLRLPLVSTEAHPVLAVQASRTQLGVHVRDLRQLLLLGAQGLRAALQGAQAPARHAVPEDPQHKGVRRGTKHVFV